MMRHTQKSWMFLIFASSFLCGVLYFRDIVSNAVPKKALHHKLVRDEKPININFVPQDDINTEDDELEEEGKEQLNQKASNDEVTKINDAPEDDEEEYVIHYASHDEINMPHVTPLIGIACEFSNSTHDKLYESVKLYLKSLVLFNEQIVNVILIINTNQEGIGDIMSTFPMMYRRRLNITIVNSWFPTKKLETGYNRICGAQRHVLAQMFPGLNTAFYTDIDVAFLRPVSDLFEEFSNFNKTQFIGVCGISVLCCPKNIKMCYNSGFLLLNLTRLRDFDVDWVKLLVTLQSKAIAKGKYNDQHLMALVQQEHPEIFYGVSETWNVRQPSCVIKGNLLADVKGWSIVHGVRNTFNTDPGFRLIAKHVRTWNLTESTDFFVKKLYTMAQKLVRSPAPGMTCPKEDYIRWVTFYPKKTFYKEITNDDFL